MSLGLRKSVPKNLSPCVASTKIIPPANSDPTPLKEQSLAMSFVTPEAASVIDQVKIVTMDEIEMCENTENILMIYETLKQQIVSNEAKLRKLKLIEKHYSKCKPEFLDQLTQRWRTACQEALRDFHNRMPEPKQDFNIMMHQMQIENQLVKYDEETDVFYQEP